MHSIEQLHGSVFFASDLHLGFPDDQSSLAREQRFIRWLDFIQPQADALFIVGDLFDFWFEYKEAVPRGYVRVLGKLALMRDAGLPIYFFTGNHDQWVKDYFRKELHVEVFIQPQLFEIAGKKFFIAHGDGLGPGDHGYKFLKKIFRGRFSRWLFARLHPNFGIWLGKKWSRNNRLLSGEHQEKFLGEDKEWLIQFSKQYLQKEHIDYFIFGHRHIMLDFELNPTSHYINLGDWITFNSYGVFDGKNFLLKTFPSK